MYFSWAWNTQIFVRNVRRNVLMEKGKNLDLIKFFHFFLVRNCCLVLIWVIHIFTVYKSFSSSAQYHLHQSSVILSERSKPYLGTILAECVIHFVCNSFPIHFNFDKKKLSTKFENWNKVIFVKRIVIYGR